MITLEQAKELRRGDVLHDDTATNADGSCARWRVNGMVKTWKTRPNEVRVPLKHGLYGPHGYLDEGNLNEFHLASEYKEDG